VIKATTIWRLRAKSGATRVLGVALFASLACLLTSSPAAASPAWLAPADLSVPGRDSTEPVLAMDESGETVAVWERQSESEVGQVVQAATRSPGAAFSAPLELSNAADEPTVAITPSGEAVAVWRHFFQEEVEEKPKGFYAVQASYRPAGGSFSAPVNVAVTPSNDLPQDIHVAIDAGGDTAVVWTQEEPELKDASIVKASLRPAGGSFAQPVSVSPTPLVAEHPASDPRVAIDAGGETMAVWTYYNGTNDAVQAARGTVAGGFSAPLELSASGQEAASPSIALSPAGEATAVWAASNGTNHVIEAASAQPGSGFSTPLPLSAPGQNAFEPAVATSPSGAQIAVWTRYDGANYIIEAAGGTGGSFTSPLALSEPGEEAVRPQVSESRSGSAAIVWQRSNGSNEIVQAVVGSPGNFSAPASLSATGQDSLFPMVAVDGEGDAAVVWRAEGESKVIQAAGYDADAPILRGLSVPHSGTVGVPVTFSASPFDVWPIASTSFSFGDGSIAEGTSVSHVYILPGTYQVTVTAKDPAGSAVSGGGTISVRPPNEFAIGRLSRNRRRGTAVLAVSVPWAGRLALSGKGVRKAVRRPQRPATVKLPIVARGAARRRLRTQGAARVSLAITFTPSGGEVRVERKRVALVEKVR